MQSRAESRAEEKEFIILNAFQDLAKAPFWRTQGGSSLFGAKVPDGIQCIAQTRFPNLLTLLDFAQKKINPNADFKNHPIRANTWSVYKSIKDGLSRSESTKSFYEFIVRECLAAKGNIDQFDLTRFEERVLQFKQAHGIKRPIYINEQPQAELDEEVTIDQMIIRDCKAIANHEIWHVQGKTTAGVKLPSSIQAIRDTEFVTLRQLQNLIHDKTETPGLFSGRSEATSAFYKLIDEQCKLALEKGDNFDIEAYNVAIASFTEKYDIDLDLQAEDVSFDQGVAHKH